MTPKEKLTEAERLIAEAMKESAVMEGTSRIALDVDTDFAKSTGEYRVSLSLYIESRTIC